MLNMLEWLCGNMMEAEVMSQIGAQKHEQSDNAQAIEAVTVRVAWTPEWHDIPDNSQG